VKALLPILYNGQDKSIVFSCRRGHYFHGDFGFHVFPPCSLELVAFVVLPLEFEQQTAF
jgi:hypothetical protein